MTNTNSKTSRKEKQRIILGVLVSVAALAVVLVLIDFDELRENLREFRYIYLAPALGLFFLSLGARAMAWRTLLPEPVSFGRTFLTLNEGYLLNNILPFRLGEVGRAIMMARATSMNFWQVFPTVLVERAFDMALAAAILLASLPFVLGIGGAQQTAVVLLGIVILGLFTLYLLARNREWALSLFDKMVTRWPLLGKMGRERVSASLSGLSALTDLRRFAVTLFWMAVVWIATAGEYYLLLLAFYPQAELYWATLALGAAAMGVAVPSAPGLIGTLHAAIVLALSLVQVNASLAGAYAFVVHLIYYSITTFLGLFALARDGESLWQLYRRIRQRPANAS